MKTILILGCVLIITSSAFSQKLDLIVTSNGDSIACQIDSISNSHIYFEMIANGGHTVKTLLEIEKVKEFKEDFIVEKNYTFKPGTSVITGIKYSGKCKSYSKQNLEKASLKELDYCLIRAKKLKKTGVILSVGGPVSAVTGLLMFNASWAGNFGGSGTAGLGLIMFLGGTGVTVVGLPILITGSSRVKKINDAKSITFNDIQMDLAPCSIYNYASQNYQSGIALRIRF